MRWRQRRGSRLSWQSDIIGPVCLSRIFRRITRRMKSNAHLPNALQVCVIVVGYLIAIFGALSVFRFPLAVSLLTLVAGLGVVTLASRRGYSPPRFTWRTGLVWVAGSAVILGVLWLIGEDRVRHWTPHPAGYQVVWLICLVLFRHLRQIFHHGASSSRDL